MKSPKSEYKSEEKNKYRQELWHCVFNAIQQTGGQELKEDRIKFVIMPSKHGLEIPILLSKGVSENQIVCIEENSALIANSKWRKDYPNVNFFSCKISEAGKKIDEKGWKVCAANLDFCNNFSEDLINEYETFVKDCPKSFHFYCSYTIMKGRETKALTHLLKRKNNLIFKEGRLSALIEAVEHEKVEDLATYFPLNCGSYKSDYFTVVWGTILYIKNIELKSDKEAFGWIDYFLNVYLNSIQKLSLTTFINKSIKEHEVRTLRQCVSLAQYGEKLVKDKFCN